MSLFELAHAITCKNEGGYSSNTTTDRGNIGKDGQFYCTYCGITEKNFPQWAGFPIIKEWVAKNGAPKHYGLVPDDRLIPLVAEFYKKEFWDKCKCDDILDQNIANSIFDLAVTSGPGTSIKNLQKAINYINSNNAVTVDGVIGSKTVVAVNSHRYPKALLNSFNFFRASFYNAIITNDQTNTQWKNKNSWFSRI